MTTHWCACGLPAAIFVQTLPDADGRRPHRSPSYSACAEHAMQGIADVATRAHVIRLQVTVLA